MDETAAEADLQLEAIVQSSVDLIESTYHDAIGRGMKQPVVVLVDCEDEIGGEIARAWLGDDVVDQAIEDLPVHDTQQQTTVFARPVSFKQCRREIPVVFPYLTESLQTPPADAILIVAVTAGGAATFTLPIE